MRDKLAKLTSLSAEQWWVAAVSAVLLPIVRLSLNARGFKRTAGSLAMRSQRRAIAAAPNEARPIAEAVALVAGRSFIGSRCLGRSLVVWFLLRRRGIDAELVLGAETPNGGELPAHAWVEVSRVPVNDAPDVRERFGSFELKLPRLAGANDQ